MIKYITGNCPKYNIENQISVTYNELRMAGCTKTNYRKMTYSCEKMDSEGCDIEPCPIYSKCPISL